jgi:ankyrin repeat protein
MGGNAQVCVVGSPFLSDTELRAGLQVDVVNLLLDRGAAINARGMYGDTALHLA